MESQEGSWIPRLRREVCFTSPMSAAAIAEAVVDEIGYKDDKLHVVADEYALHVEYSFQMTHLEIVLSMTPSPEGTLLEGHARVGERALLFTVLWIGVWTFCALTNTRMITGMSEYISVGTLNAIFWAAGMVIVVLVWRQTLRQRDELLARIQRAATPAL